MMKAGIIIRKREVGNSCFEQNSIHSFFLRKERESDKIAHANQ